MFNTTALFLAVDEENIDIVKLLLANEKLDVNALKIFYYFFLIKKSKILDFNRIQNHFFLI